MFLNACRKPKLEFLLYYPLPLSPLLPFLPSLLSSLLSPPHPHPCSSLSLLSPLSLFTTKPFCYGHSHTYTRVEGTVWWTARPSSEPLGPVCVIYIPNFSPAKLFYSTFQSCNLCVVVILNVFFEWSVSKYAIFCPMVKFLWAAGSAEQCVALLLICFCLKYRITYFLSS